MDIFVCYKLTPEQKDIRISNGAVQTDQAEGSVGEYDLVATEAAAQLATTVGWGVKGVSVGGMQLSNSRARKNMLSRGWCKVRNWNRRTATRQPEPWRMRSRKRVGTG